MAWIAKRSCKISRKGKTIVVPPGEPVPEAATWKNPTMWCVWSPNEAPATVAEKPVIEKDPDNDEGGAKDPAPSDSGGDENPEPKKHPDYSKYQFKDLRKLAGKAQEITKDVSVNLKKATKDELIVTIKSVKVEDLEG